MDESAGLNRQPIKYKTGDSIPDVCTGPPAAPPAGLHEPSGTKRALLSSPVNLLFLKTLVWSVALGWAVAGWAYHPG